MAKYKKKQNADVVDARQIGKNGESLILKDGDSSIQIFAKEGEWLITEQNGNQFILTNSAFKLQFSNRQLLLD